MNRIWILFFAAACGVVGYAVDNPSFEGGFDNWTAGRNMSIDGEVFHSGRASAKVVVADPLKDEIYLSRTLPVIGGAGYAAPCRLARRHFAASISLRPGSFVCLMGVVGPVSVCQ